MKSRTTPLGIRTTCKKCGLPVKDKGLPSGLKKWCLCDANKRLRK